MAHKSVRLPLYKHLYFQVIVAIAIGLLIGALAPAVGIALKPLGDLFIKLIKMMIAPVIFATVVVGIAKMGDMKEVGRVGVKALVYFEAVSTLSLILGLIVVNLAKPGSGINADPASLDVNAVAAYTASAKALSVTDFVLHMIPESLGSAFAGGDILQVLLVSILVGLGLARLGDKGKALTDFVEHVSHVLFDVIAIIMRLAPLGALGAMAFTVGKYGLHSLLSLGELMGCVYLTCILFVLIGLGLIAKLTGFSIFRFLAYIKEEILIVLGTSSSETALPRLMTKLENAGCAKTVVGLVVPTGYSFNLDGTSIYLTMAALFVAQATNVHLSIGQQLAILAILLLTSKGAAAVTGSGFITLAATLSATGTIPVAGLALLLGIDRFMSEARAITNLIGNGVATVVVAKWEKALDIRQLQAALAGTNALLSDEPEAISDLELDK